MASGSFRFDRFLLDPDDRLLTRDGAPVELNARYLDALVLLVREQGRLVSKDRFHAEVWRGVPVTDEALTQCIRTLRKQLGDDAARPRFIETAPKHGYRFIAAVEAEASDVSARAAPDAPMTDHPWRRLLLLGGAGTLGAGLAGAVGGLIYGFAAAAQPGAGAASVLLVLLLVTTAIALVGGAGVAFGIALADFARGRAWRIAGGAAGGLLVGAVVKLLGLDAFNLLLGQSPGDITGAAEGVLLGAGVGAGAWLAGLGPEPDRSLPRAAAIAGIVGGATGMAISLLGGRLMAGSLDLLARHFPASHLRLDPIAGLLGEAGFGPVTRTLTATLEGALFGACIVGAMLLARRRIGRGEPR